eukprot:822667-Pelagomonas_calceolata.AAC.5
MLAMLNIMQICEDCGANAVTMLRYSQDIIKQEQREGHSGQHFAAGQRQVQQQQQAAAQRAQQQRQQQQQAAAQRAQPGASTSTPSAAAPSVSSGPSPRITAYSQQLTNLVKGRPQARRVQAVTSSPRDLVKCSFSALGEGGVLSPKAERE